MNRIESEEKSWHRCRKQARTRFQIVKYDVTHHSDEIRANFDALENKDVCIAGQY